MRDFPTWLHSCLCADKTSNAGGCTHPGGEISREFSEWWRSSPADGSAADFYLIHTLGGTRLAPECDRTLCSLHWCSHFSPVQNTLSLFLLWFGSEKGSISFNMVGFKRSGSATHFQQKYGLPVFLTKIVRIEKGPVSERWLPLGFSPQWAQM